jgi:hypothetical protein
MPYPSLTFAAQLSQATRAELEQFISLLQGYLSTQHNDDGSHAAITATSVTATGAGTFGGDVVAQNGTGSETGIGTLSTVNGTALLSGETVRQGLLIGGASVGVFIERRTGQSPMDGSTTEICVWNLAFSTTKPVYRLGIISGIPALIDGGTGSTPIALGDFNRPVGTLYTNTLSTPSGTMALDGNLSMPNNKALQMKSVGGTALDVLHVDASGNGHVIGGHNADFPLGLVQAPAASINTGSANMNGGLLWDSTNSWLVGYVNGVRYKFVGTAY